MPWSARPTSGTLRGGVPFIDDLDLGRRFDDVRAFSVLTHMHDAVLADCLRFVQRHLADEARMLELWRLQE